MLALWYLICLVNGRYPKSKEKCDLAWLEDAFLQLTEMKTNSLLKKHLSRTLFEKLKNRRTALGSTLKSVIQGGILYPECGIGVHATDADAYSVFHELFDAIIEDYHIGFLPSHKACPPDCGNASYFSDMDPSAQYIISTRVRSTRNVMGFPFVPHLKRDELLHLECLIVSALHNLKGDFRGIYFSYPSLYIKDMLQKENLCFENYDPILDAIGCYNFWPVGRGIFHNLSKTLLAWVNEEDHLRVMSMERGGNLRSVYTRFVEVMTALSSQLSFSWDDRLGFISVSPLNLGTSLRVTVQIRLPNLANTADGVCYLMNLCSKLKLAVSPLQEAGDTFDIYNRFCLGLTEYECVKYVHDGILKIIDVEQTYFPREVTMDVKGSSSLSSSHSKKKVGTRNTGTHSPVQLSMVKVSSRFKSKVFSEEGADEADV